MLLLLLLCLLLLGLATSTGIEVDEHSLVAKNLLDIKEIPSVPTAAPPINSTPILNTTPPAIPLFADHQLDGSWLEDVQAKVAAIGRAISDADGLAESTLLAFNEVVSISALQQSASKTKADIISQSEALALSSQPPSSAITTDAGVLPSNYQHLLHSESWTNAGYHNVEEFDQAKARNITHNLPLSSYRKYKDPQEAAVVARDKSKDEIEMLTRRHIGPINTDAAQNILSDSPNVDLTDPTAIAFLSLKATAELADDLDAVVAKVETIDALLRSDDESNALISRIAAMQSKLDDDKNRTSNDDDDGYKSITQLAWEALALEAEASAKEVAVIAQGLRHSVRMKALESKFAAKDTLMEEHTKSLSQINDAESSLSFQRNKALLDAEADLDCTIEEINSLYSVEEGKRATERELDLVSKRGDAEASREAAQVAAEAELEREQEQASMERISVTGEERRKQAVEFIGIVLNYLKDGFNHILYTSDGKKQCILASLVAALLVFVIATSRESISLCFSSLQRLLMTPSLVREYGRCRWIQRRQAQSSNGVFRDVILPFSLKERVMTLTKSVRNARRYDAPYRHVLLHGLPGTGKTMVAKKIAQCTGMDYAIMSGGDVGPLGADAVTQIHDLFRWARSSRRGVLLFIDEAEAFLGNRKNGDMSEHTHNALNALLYNTGVARRDFMLVLATNRPEDLDDAILDRCDEFINFPLPDAECREKLLTQYYQDFLDSEISKTNETRSSAYSKVRSVFSKKVKSPIQVEEGLFEGENLKSIIAETDGFSCRELGKLIISIQAALYSSDTGRLNFAAVQRATTAKVNNKRRLLQLRDSQ